MYPDYNNMYNPYNGMNFGPRIDQQPIMQTQEKNPEIITLPEAVNLIRSSVADEKSDEMFYDELIKQAPSDKEKSIIMSIRDDERKHNKILRNLYFKFTSQTLPEASQTQIPPQMQNKKTYQENLETALFGELDAVVKYRRIMGAMPDNDSYTLIMSIMTDEIRHACKYNFLIHSAGKTK